MAGNWPLAASPRPSQLTVCESLAVAAGGWQLADTAPAQLKEPGAAPDSLSALRCWSC